MNRPRITSPNVAVEPDCWRRPALVDAVVAGGGTVVAPAEAEALVWAEPAAPELLPGVLQDGPGIEWVQLPYAGIENLTHLLDRDHRWTCGKGVYAEPVAEHVLMLALAGLRGMGSFARARSWSPPQGRNLLGGRVTVLGGGGINRIAGPLAGTVGLPDHRAAPPPLPPWRASTGWSAPKACTTP